MTGPKPDKSKNKARARDFFEVSKPEGAPALGSEEEVRHEKPRLAGSAPPRPSLPPIAGNAFALDEERTPKADVDSGPIAGEETDAGLSETAGEDTASDHTDGFPTSAMHHDAKAATTQQMDELDHHDAPLMDALGSDESPAGGALGNLDALRVLAGDLPDPRKKPVPITDETVRSTPGAVRELQIEEKEDEDTRRSMLKGGNAPARSSVDAPFPRPASSTSTASKPPAIRLDPPAAPPPALPAPKPPAPRAEPPPAQRATPTPPSIKKPLDAGAKKPTDGPAKHDEVKKPLPAAPPPAPKKAGTTAESRRSGSAKVGDAVAPDRGATTEILEGAAELARFPGSGEGRIPLILGAAGFAAAGAVLSLVDPLVGLPVAVATLVYVGIDQLQSVRLVARGDRVRGNAPRAAEAASLSFTVIALWLSCFAPAFLAYAAVPSRIVIKATPEEDFARRTESLAKLLIAERGVSPEEARKQAKAQLTQSDKEEALAGRAPADSSSTSGLPDRRLFEIGALALGLFGVAYLPMALLLTALRASPAASFGYLTGLGAIARFVTPYMACAGCFIAGAAALFGIDVALGPALRMAGLPDALAAALRGAILGGALAYLMAVGAYLVGRLFHRDGWQLGWGEVL